MEQYTIINRMKNVQYLLYNIRTKTVQKTYILDFTYIPDLTVLLTKDIETSLPNKTSVLLPLRSSEGYTLLTISMTYKGLLYEL